MNCPGHAFLSAPGLSGNENGGIGRGNLSDLRKYCLQRGRRTNDAFENCPMIELSVQHLQGVLGSILFVASPRALKRQERLIGRNGQQ